MRVLFVCYGNIGRSQVAQTYFDLISEHDSESAGTGADKIIALENHLTRKLKETTQVPGSSVQYIEQEFGVDVSERERQQLRPELIETADRVIMIVEKNRWPEYVEESGKVAFWDIPDPYDRSDDSINEIFQEVRLRVEQLVEEIG